MQSLRHRGFAKSRFLCVANWRSRFAKETGNAGLSFAHTKQIQLGRTGTAGSSCVMRPGFVGIRVSLVVGTDLTTPNWYRQG
jgi:hypothetical protein